MLDAAIEHAKAHGATLLEAYPVDTAGERVPAAHAYRGTLRMFEAAGFTEVARRRANASSPERPIVRLEIRAGRSTSSVPSGRPSSARVDTALPRRLDCRPACRSPALV